MDKELSNINKLMQQKIHKKDTFKEGIDTLLLLRSKLKEIIDSFKELPKEYYFKQPFINAEGYKNKTIAYSFYHVARIEDIVVNTLILKKDDIFTSNSYQKKMNSSIKTTGNELVKEQIGEFSSLLDIIELFRYFNDVFYSTNEFIKGLKYEDLHTNFDEKDKKLIESKNVVSKNENAIWLIDYWTSKDILGLIKMPLSRHYIMHVEAALRIKEKIEK